MYRETSKQSHKKLSQFVKRLDQDISSEAGIFADSIDRLAQLAPQIPQETEKVKLKLKDGRTYDIPVLSSPMGEKYLDIRALYAVTDMFMFDPGYTITGSCVSAISYAHPSGKLLYRGYRIEELVAKSTYIEVCFLLLYGQLPTKVELQHFEEKIKDEMVVHSKLQDFYKGFSVDAHPMSIMCSISGALSSFIHNTLDIKDPLQRELSAIKLIAKMPVLAAIAFRTSAGLPIVYPQRKLSYIQNFLHMMFADPMDPDFSVPQIFVDVLDKVFILHADCEQGPSTTAVRIAGSSLANPFATIAAGIASLWGPTHGGANEESLKMFEEIGDVANIQHYLDQVKRKEKKLMGFGHRVFKAYDPRAKILKDLCLDLFYKLDIKDPLFEVALKLEEIALKDEYFSSRHLYTNVDYYMGFALKTLQIPKNMFNVVFAITRSIGWISHWREMMSDPVIKIGRPRQIYVGNKLKKVVKIGERENVPSPFKKTETHYE